MDYNELENTLFTFLERWPRPKVEKMTLEEYVGVENKDTFCQWVETKCRSLGSIKGMTSIKFGIYERKVSSNKPKNYAHDNRYSWLRRYGDSREEVFNNIKREILQIIDISEKGEFSKIDQLNLPDLFKWKIASLYSNQRLVPIFKKNTLLKIAKNYGYNVSRKTPISDIHEVMINNKLPELSVYEYMYKLYAQFGHEKQDINLPDSSSKKGKRKPAKSRNLKSEVRRINTSYIVDQKHNKIQEKLRDLLSQKYGPENVLLEENYVDLKLIQPDYISFYEVKSASFASLCIKEALGQILLYSHRDQDSRLKKIIVVGQFPPTKKEKYFIKYLKAKLNLDFEYLTVSLN